MPRKTTLSKCHVAFYWFGNIYSCNIILFLLYMEIAQFLKKWIIFIMWIPAILIPLSLHGGGHCHYWPFVPKLRSIIFYRRKFSQRQIWQSALYVCIIVYMFIFCLCNENHRSIFRTTNYFLTAIRLFFWTPLKIMSSISLFLCHASLPNSSDIIVSYTLVKYFSSFFQYSGPFSFS